MKDKRNITLVMASLLSAAALFFAAGCSGESTPEEESEGALDRAEEAAGQAEEQAGQAEEAMEGM